MRKPLITDDTSLASARALDVRFASVQPEGATPASPGEVVMWLARLRLLHGVPFAYLAAHDEMVPNESIRFFHIDRNWLDAAVDGALSVAAVTARDRELLAALLADLRAEVDGAERRIREIEDNAARAKNEPLPTDEAIALTGFVLRSSAVSGWPGMEVRASERSGSQVQRLRFLRLERLAPGVLLAIIDGVPDRIELTEPRSGIQFGVDAKDDGGAVLPLRHPADGRSLPLRDPDTGELEPGGGPTFDAAVVPGELRGESDDLRVPFREGGHGTLHVAELVRRLRGVSFDDRPLVAAHTPPDEPGAPPSGPASDDLAVQLLQFPYRQPFEGDGERGGDGPFAGFVRGDLTIHLDRVFITR